MIEPEPMEVYTRLVLLDILAGCINHLDKAPSVVLPVIKELGKILEIRKIHSEKYINENVLDIRSRLVSILERRWIEMDSKGLTKVRTKDS